MVFFDTFQRIFKYISKTYERAFINKSDVLSLNLVNAYK